MDDAFGWSTQQYYAAEPCQPSRPSDDDGLLSAFMCTSFQQYGLDSSNQRGSLDMSSASQTLPNLVHCHDGGASLSHSVLPAAFMGMADTAVDMLPSATDAAVDDGVFDAFACVAKLAEGPAQATTVSNSNSVFSGYSSNTGSNANISAGESNTCGGQDIEVASRPTLLQTPMHPPCKRKLVGKYPAPCASATTATAERRGAKRSAAPSSSSTSITFGGKNRRHHQASRIGTGSGYDEPADAEAIAQAKEVIYRAAAMRPVHQLLVSAEPPPAPSSHQQNKPRRKNVRISSDPQTVAARLRRERISERLRVLQRLVPGGSRMDTASMLDEAASYLKFLKSQLNKALGSSAGNPNHHGGGGYCNGGRPLQNYMGSSLGGGGASSSSSTVVAFGSRDGIGGYVKSNRTMPVVTYNRYDV